MSNRSRKFIKKSAEDKPKFTPAVTIEAFEAGGTPDSSSFNKKLPGVPNPAGRVPKADKLLKDDSIDDLIVADHNVAHGLNREFQAPGALGIATGVHTSQRGDWAPWLQPIAYHPWTPGFLAGQYVGSKITDDPMNQSWLSIGGGSLWGAGLKTLEGKYPSVFNKYVNPYAKGLVYTQMGIDSAKELHSGWNDKSSYADASMEIAPHELSKFDINDSANDDFFRYGTNIALRTAAYGYNPYVGLMTGPLPVHPIGAYLGNITKSTPESVNNAEYLLMARTRRALHQPYFPAVGSAPAMSAVHREYDKLTGLTSTPNKQMLQSFKQYLTMMGASNIPGETSFSELSKAYTGEANPYKGAYIFDTMLDPSLERNRRLRDAYIHDTDPKAVALRNEYGHRITSMFPPSLYIPPKVFAALKALPYEELKDHPLYIRYGELVRDRAADQYLLDMNRAEISRLVSKLNISPYEAALILRSGINIEDASRSGRALDPRNEYSARLELADYLKDWDEIQPTYDKMHFFE